MSLTVPSYTLHLSCHYLVVPPSVGGCRGCSAHTTSTKGLASAKILHECLRFNYALSSLQIFFYVKQLQLFKIDGTENPIATLGASVVCKPVIDDCPLVVRVNPSCQRQLERRASRHVKCWVVVLEEKTLLSGVL